MITGRINLSNFLNDLLVVVVLYRNTAADSRSSVQRACVSGIWTIVSL